MNVLAVDPRHGPRLRRRRRRRGPRRRPRLDDGDAARRRPPGRRADGAAPISGSRPRLRRRHRGRRGPPGEGDRAAGRAISSTRRRGRRGSSTRRRTSSWSSATALSPIARGNGRIGRATARRRRGLRSTTSGAEPWSPTPLRHPTLRPLFELVPGYGDVLYHGSSRPRPSSWRSEPSTSPRATGSRSGRGADRAWAHGTLGPSGPPQPDLPRRAHGRPGLAPSPVVARLDPHAPARLRQLGPRRREGRAARSETTSRDSSDSSASRASVRVQLLELTLAPVP